MDSTALKREGAKMLQVVGDHWDSLRTKRTPFPAVQPGYLQPLIPSEPPQSAEEWEKIFGDLEKVVMEGNTNWHHHHFFGYFPTACSYPSIVADILSGGISAMGFTWKSCPSMTELEHSMLDWLVVALGLPDHFRFHHEGHGAGVIQSTASEASLVAVLAARSRAVEGIKDSSGVVSQWLESPSTRATVQSTLDRIKRNDDESGPLPSDVVSNSFHDSEYFGRLVAYTSDQAHCSVDKAFFLGGVKYRKLKSTIDPLLGNYEISAETLEKAIEEDRGRSLLPFLFVATLGTTNTSGVDFPSRLGPICNREGLWLHVDAAYAGAFLICPEFRYMAEGLEMVDSFNYNAHKAMMVNFDCSPLWFKDAREATKYFYIDTLILRHEKEMDDLRHLSTALGRRFRSLKIWLTLRALGVDAIQSTLRGQCERASLFEDLVRGDSTVALFLPRHLAHVTFLLKEGDNAANEKLCSLINEDGRILVVPALVHGSFVLRLSVATPNTTDDDIRFAFNVITEIASKHFR